MKKAFLAAAVLAGLSAAAQNVAQYHVLKTFHIQSEGKWDYIALSPVTNNLYVSHGTQVNILDRTTGDSTGVILNTTGVHGIAFAPQFGKGFTSNGKINTVTVFDIKTNEVQAQIKTGENPDAIMYEPFSKKVLTCNGRSKDLSVIDPVTNKVVNTVPLGGKPETAVSDGAGNIYINIEDKNEIVWIDAKTFTVKAHWPLGGAEGPTGLAIDAKTKRLFAGCNMKLVVMNAATGEVVTTMPIGDGCDGVVFDPASKYVFTSNGDGTMNVIKEMSPDKYLQVAKAVTKKGARTIAIDEKTHILYLPTSDFKPVEKVAEGKPSRPDMIPGTFQILEVGFRTIVIKR
jgi:YVTN family beta-propeller protein